MAVNLPVQPPGSKPEQGASEAGSSGILKSQSRRTTLLAGAWLAGRGTQVAMQSAGPLAWLAQGTNARAQAGSAATVELLRAPAWIEVFNNKVPLAAGALVGALQTVVTGDDARLVLKLPEGSLITLGANSRMTIESLAYERSAAGNVLTTAVRLAIGTFRYITAVSEKLSGKNRKVNFKTATATIGIRGTRFWGQANAQHEMVCLFEGAVDIERANEPLVLLDAPNAFWIAPTGQAALPVTIATPEQLRGFGGQVSTLEGSGLATLGGGFSVASNIWLESRAKALAEQLASLGYVAVVTPCLSGAASMFDVTVGSLSSAADAKSVAAKLGALVQRRFELVQPAK